MKNTKLFSSALFGFMFTLASSNVSNAQDSYVSISNTGDQTTYRTSKDAVIIANDDQLKSTLTQINDHLSKNIQYPQRALDYNLEGEVTIELTIAQSGKIESYQIIKGDSNLFDTAVLNSLKSLHNIETEGKIYHGASKIQFPIKFTNKR